MWIFYALLSAFFAALTSILAKTGMKNVNSNVGTAWLIVFLTGKYKEIPDITQKSWIFLILSGIATGLSWLCYFKALQIGEASKVVPVDKFSVVITMILAFLFLGEPLNAKTILGGVIITIGMLVLVL